MRRVAQFLIIAVVAAVPAGSTVRMKSHTFGTGANDKPNQAVEMSFEGWFDNDRAVIEIVASGNPTFPRGRIFVEGETMTLYDQKKNTCTPWDMQAMMRLAGAMLNAVGGMIQLEFGDPKVEILDHEKSAAMFGLATDYYKYRSDWTMSIKAPLMKKKTFDSSTVQEVWVAKALADELPALGVFMDADAFTTGHEEMDEAIAASMPPIEGSVLKSVAVSQTTNQKGKVETTTTTTEVTELDRSAADPAGGYSPPADCEFVAPLAGPIGPGTGDAGAEGDSQADQQQGEKPWQKVKVKNPFKKKKKDDG